MPISAEANYLVAYSSVSFEPYTNFLDQVRRRYPNVEIPFLDLEGVPEEEREPFDNYIYVLAGPDAETTVARINRDTHGGRAFPVRFEALSELKGSAVLGMLEHLSVEFEAEAENGLWFRVKAGPYRNKVVKFVSRDETTGETTVSFEIFEEERRITVDAGNLESVPAPRDPYASFVNLLRTAPIKGAVIIDGDNELHNAGRRYPHDHARVDPSEVERALKEGREPPTHGQYIGSAHGFYFSILRFRRIYADRDLFVVFDGQQGGLGRFECATWTDEMRQMYTDCRNWVKEFVLACGCSVVELPGYRAEDAIASLVHSMTNRFGYREVLIHTKGDALFSLVSPQIDLILPKQNFRDHPPTIQVPEALAKFGLVREPGVFDPDLISRIDWVRAISGDVAAVPSVNLYNKLARHPCTAIRQTDYLPHVLAANNVDQLKLELLRFEAFQPFITSGQFDKNLAAVRLRPDLLDGLNSLSKFRVEDEDGCGLVDSKRIKALLRKFSLEKEYEYFDSNRRVVAGIYPP